MLQQPEYPGAIAVPTSNYFANRNGYVGPLTIIEHGTAGFPTAIAVAIYFQTGPVSAHFIIGRSGQVYQCVSIYDSCWGEGGNSSGRSYWPKGVNGNLFTIGIEHHKVSTDNSEDLTDAQYIASGKLNRWVCEKLSIPKRLIIDSFGGISGHGVLDPANRSAVNGSGGCPGTFDWNRLLTLVTTTDVPLTPSQEVASIVTPTQFEYDETWYACGFVVGGEAALMTPPYVPNPHSPEEVDVWADKQYKQEYGGIGTDQTGGVSVDDMHRLITFGGHSYHDMPVFAPTSTQESDIAHLTAILEQGFPVAITILERTAFDVLLGGRPYYWVSDTSTATHVIFATGIATVKGVLCVLVRDGANVTGDIYGVNQVRRQPRPYDINKIGIQWASVVVGQWLPTPPTTWNPLTTVINPPAQEEDAMPKLTHVKTPTVGQQQQALSLWHEYILPKENPADPLEVPQYAPYDTDIAKNWMQTVWNGLSIGAPRGLERADVDWNDAPIRRHSFDGGWAEFNPVTKATRLFVYGRGELIFSD